MKTITILIAFFCSLESFGQRYLTDDYLALDSIIAGTYGKAVDYQSNNQDLLFDFYEPANDTLSERPLIIYLHGGGYTTGSRTYPSVQILSRRMANKGYAVANIDYRLDPNFDIYNSNTDRRAMTDAMHDAKQAIRYFKANASTYKIDTSLIFIGGESAGAATSMMASFVDKQSEMESYPMANPSNPTGGSTFPGVGNGVAATMCLCGLLIDTSSMELPADPPILWIHGTDDDFVPISFAFNIVLRAINIGLPIQVKVYEGGVHCPWYYGNPNWDIYLDSTVNEITNFLYPKVANSSVSLADIKYTDDVSLYPNPFKSQLHIDLKVANVKTNIVLISLSGAIVYQKTFTSAENGIDLNLESLEPGIYILLIENKSFKAQKKVVKNW